MTALPLKDRMTNILSKHGATAGFAAGLALAAFATDGLPPPQRLTLLIATATVMAWGLALAEEWLIGIAAVLALWVAGATDGTRIVAAATHDLIFLLIAAYVISFAVHRAGLLNVVAVRVLNRPMPFRTLAWRLAIFVGATAFFIPATSARAAMLLPIHKMLVTAAPDAEIRRALTLLIPTVILLSAGGVLTGAAAHVVALEIISTTGGPKIDYWQWLILALPIAVLTCAAAVGLIVSLFASRVGSRCITAVPHPQSRTLSGSDRALLTIMAVTILLWISNVWHGAGLAHIGLASAALTLGLVCADRGTSAAAVARSIDWKILTLLISTVLVAETLVESGAVATIATALLRAVPGVILGNAALTICATAAVAMLAHLVIPSRSARAAVLIPALALPLSTAGHNLATLSLAIVLGTGFCQLAPYGAKPLMIFSGQSSDADFRADLVRLGVPLLVVSWSILVAFALVVWPMLSVFSASIRNGI